jgi:hypothetical protein
LAQLGRLPDLPLYDNATEMGYGSTEQYLQDLSETWQQIACWALQKPGGAPPCGKSGCVEIHHPLLHEQKGWHGLQGTLWDDVEPEEEQLMEETMVEQDVSVGELHT